MIEDAFCGGAGIAKSDPVSMGFRTPPVAYGVQKVPVILGSIPSPLKFFPIWSTTRTSQESTRILGILAKASCRRGGSFSMISSAFMAMILHVSSYAFSMVGTANKIGAFLMIARPNMGTYLAIFLKPASWQTSAPCCFPRPIAIIFMIPLS